MVQSIESPGQRVSESSEAKPSWACQCMEGPVVFTQMAMILAVTDSQILSSVTKMLESAGRADVKFSIKVDGQMQSMTIGDMLNKAQDCISEKTDDTKKQQSNQNQANIYQAQASQCQSEQSQQVSQVQAMTSMLTNVATNQDPAITVQCTGMMKNFNEAWSEWAAKAII